MKACNNCQSKDESVSVPYAAHELMAARQERQTKRMWIALIVSISLLFLSNAVWVWAWMQYDYESYEVSADGGSNANFIGKDGDIYNGSIGEGQETNP